MADVVCLLNVESDRATFTWSEGPASFAPYQLEGGMFTDFVECAAEARERLSDLVKDYLYDADNLPGSAFALAEAGHELYLQIFDPGAAQGRNAQEVRHWLESLRASKIIDSLEIVVDTPWSMPWNVVYDEPPSREDFLADDPQQTEHWRPFWAIRYNLTGGRRVSPLRRIPLLNDPHVLLVVDPEIRDGLPADQQQQLQDFIHTHRFQTVFSKDELVAALQERRPQLLYWLSHATPSALVLGGEEISPRQLRRLLRREAAENPYEFGGVAFLNACQTAEAGQGGSFFDAFHAVGFSGMVGTEHQTVDTFANPLGLDFLNQFLIEGKPLGSVMRRLRARVPLGLLYGTYCPPDLCVEKSLEESQIEIVHSPARQGAALAADVEQITVALPAEPYRGLSYYGYSDRALFAGRDEDVERFATILDDDDTHLVILHGESGVGKSSFLRAGVIPYLEEESVGYRFARRQAEETTSEDSILFVRATNDLAGSLAQSFSHLCAAPMRYRTPTGDEVVVDLPATLTEAAGTPSVRELREALLSDSSLAAAIMSALAEQLPFELVLVIDQAEELFTLSQPEDMENRRRSLAMLRHLANATTRFKIIVSLRTEYYGRLVDGLRRGGVETGRVREYLLTDFDEAGLVEAIKLPTRRRSVRGGEVPYKQYGFAYEHGVAEQIARRVARFSAQRRDSLLPLLQVICGQLYNLVRGRDDKLIRLADLDSIGGVEGGLNRHVESMIDELFSGSASEKWRFQHLMTQLYLRQPDGGLTTALLQEEDLAKRWSGSLAFQEVLEEAERRRLLRVNTLRIGGEDEHRYVSLGHDALAKLAAAWDEEFSRNRRMQKLLASLAATVALVFIFCGLAVFSWIGWSSAKSSLELANQREVEALTYLRVAQDNERSATDIIERIVTTISNNKDDSVQKLTEEMFAEAARQVEVLKTNAKEMKGGPSSSTLEVMSRANYWAGRIGVLVGDYDEALGYLGQALEIQNELSANTDLDLSKQRSGTLIEIGNANVRLAERAMMDDEKATSHLEEALNAYSEASKLRDALPAGLERDRLLASALMNIGVCEMKLTLREAQPGENPFHAARKHMLTASRLREDAMNRAIGVLEEADISFELGQGYQNLGELERYAQNPASAKQYLALAKQAFELVVKTYPAHSESAVSLGYCDLWIGYNLVWPAAGDATREDVQSGLEFFEQAAEAGRKISHPVLAPYAQSLIDAAKKKLATLTDSDSSSSNDP